MGMPHNLVRGVLGVANLSCGNVSSMLPESNVPHLPVWTRIWSLELVVSDAHPSVEYEHVDAAAGI